MTVQELVLYLLQGMANSRIFPDDEIKLIFWPNAEKGFQEFTVVTPTHLIDRMDNSDGERHAFLIGFDFSELDEAG